MAPSDPVSARLEFALTPRDGLPECRFSTAWITHSEAVVTDVLEAIFGPELAPRVPLERALAAHPDGPGTEQIAELRASEWDDLHVSVHVSRDRRPLQGELRTRGLVPHGLRGWHVEVALGIAISRHADDCIRYPGGSSSSPGCCRVSHFRIETQPVVPRGGIQALARVFASVPVPAHRLLANYRYLRQREVLTSSTQGRAFALPAGYRDDGFTVVEAESVFTGVARN